MKAVEEQVLIPVVLFIMLYEAVLTFQSVAYNFKCDNLNESYYARLSCGTIHYTVQESSKF